MLKETQAVEAPPDEIKAGRVDKRHKCGPRVE